MDNDGKQIVLVLMRKDRHWYMKTSAGWSDTHFEDTADAQSVKAYYQEQFGGNVKVRIEDA